MNDSIGSTLTVRISPLSFFLILCCVFVYSGCDLLRPDRPDSARIQLEGGDGVEVQLVTSTAFVSQVIEILDPDTGFAVSDSLNVVVINADTSTIVLPFERVYDISENEQFYAYILRSEPEQDGLRSRIWIDDDLRMDERPTPDANPVIFVYDFRNLSDGGTDIVF